MGINTSKGLKNQENLNEPFMAYSPFNRFSTERGYIPIKKQ